MKTRTIALLLAIAPATAFAHHSRLFLRTTTYDLGHPFEWEFLANATMLKTDAGTEYEIEPGLFFATGARADWGFEVHGHFAAPAGSGLGFEAAGLEVRHRLTYNPGTNYALGFEYEDNPGNTEPGDFQLQVIAGDEEPGRAWMANLNAEMANASRQQVHFGYSLAVGRTAGATMGYALELSGDLESRGAHELLPEVSWAFGDKALVKLGVGIGLTKESPDYTIRVGFASKVN